MYEDNQRLSNARLYWQNNNLDNVAYVLLLPHGDAYFNAKLHTAFAAKLGERQGIIIEGQQTDDLLTLYSLYAFTDKLIIGSFGPPHGRKLRNLIDSGIATEETLINDVILEAM
jgi:hypothetical protein